MYLTDPKAKVRVGGGESAPWLLRHHKIDLFISLSQTTTCSVYPRYVSACALRDNKQSRATLKARALANSQYPTFLCTDALCPKNADPKLKNDNLKTFPFVDIKNMTSTTTKLTTTTMVLCAVLLGSPV